MLLIRKHYQNNPKAKRYFQQCDRVIYLTPKWSLLSNIFFAKNFYSFFVTKMGKGATVTHAYSLWDQLLYKRFDHCQRGRKYKDRERDARRGGGGVCVSALEVRERVSVAVGSWEGQRERQRKRQTEGQRQRERHRERQRKRQRQRQRQKLSEKR